jgi:hypothetical protein
VNFEGLNDDVGDRHSRVEGCIGILENVLHLASKSQDLSSIRVLEYLSDIFSLKENLAGCWWFKIQHTPGYGSFSRAALSN